MSVIHPPIKVERDDEYKTIIVNGVFGGHRPGFFEAIVYSDEMVADEALGETPPDNKRISFKRILRCRLLMDPIEAKVLANWLSQHVSRYEKEFGKIVMPGAVKGKAKPDVYI